MLLSYDYVVGKTVINHELVKTIADDYERVTVFKGDKRILRGTKVNVIFRWQVIEVIGEFDLRLQSGVDMKFADRVRECS